SRMNVATSLGTARVNDLTVANGDSDAAALVQRLAAGERDALVELYRLYQRPLFRYLTQLTADHGLAEEVLQDAFVAAWQSAASFERRSSVQTWLFGITRRQAHNAFRKRGLPLEDETALAQTSDPDPMPEDLVLART